MSKRKPSATVSEQVEEVQRDPAYLAAPPTEPTSAPPTLAPFRPDEVVAAVTLRQLLATSIALQKPFPELVKALRAAQALPKEDAERLLLSAQ